MDRHVTPRKVVRIGEKAHKKAARGTAGAYGTGVDEGHNQERD